MEEMTMSERKLNANAVLTACVQGMVKIFGEKEAAKMLRAAAKMIAPTKADK